MTDMPNPMSKKEAYQRLVEAGPDAVYMRETTLALARAFGFHPDMPQVRRYDANATHPIPGPSVPGCHAHHLAFQIARHMGLKPYDSFVGYRELFRTYMSAIEAELEGRNDGVDQALTLQRAIRKRNAPNNGGGGAGTDDSNRHQEDVG